MSSDWPLVQLSEILNLKTGRLDSNAAEDGGEYPFFTCSPTTLAISSYAFDSEAVLLAGNNANGVFAVKYYKGKFNAYQRTYVITPIDKKIVNVRWLYFRIKHVTSELQQMSVGTATKFLTKKILDAYEVHLPPYKEQEDIANILWSLQDKIELNTQTNQTLEQIAQAIFKSWFVDFDPVKAKMTALAAGGSREDAERAAMCAISGKDESLLAAMQREQPAAYAELAATAALFPAAMQASELGDVPEGWEVKSLSDMIILTGGGTPKRSEASYWGGQIKWLSVKDVPADGNIFVVDTEEKITDLGLQKSSTKLLRKGTTIITARGTVGKLALLAEDMCMNQSCYGVNGNNIGDYFSYFNLCQAIATLTRNTHGAVFDTITTKTFDTYRTSFCGTALAERFEVATSAVMEKIESNVRENINLSQLRDSLLPKLLSGEIDLSNNINEANV